MMRRYLGIAPLAALLLCLAVPAAAEPAMWVVKDEDSTVYLFGTVHMLRPETVWQSDKLKAAFAASSELWLENAFNKEKDSPAIQALIKEHGMDEKTLLSSKLSPEARGAFNKALLSRGINPVLLEKMRPWLASFLVGTPAAKAGFDPDKGADAVLEADGKAAHKSVRGLETVEQEIMFFANLPRDTEIALLNHAVKEADTAASHLDRIVVAWLAADLATLGDLSMSRRIDEPAVYQTLIVLRNNRWTNQLARVMQGSGTSFVAVGAAHLLGPDSLQVQLQQRGFTVEPY